MKGITHFPGLNGIRAIAAMTVVLCHTDQFTKLFGLPALGFHRTGVAANAVDLFFVLSGFLITYLLLQEKEAHGAIAVGRFYLRRILRIWPAYYLAMGLALVLAAVGWAPWPADTWTAVAFYLLLAANAGYALGHVLKAAVPLWSVGVEEQFYLLWPHVVGRVQRTDRAIIAVILLYLGVKLAAHIYPGPGSAAYEFLYLTRIDILGLGALGAYWVHTDHPILRPLFHKGVQALAWVLLAGMLLIRPAHLYSFIDPELNALVHLVLILNVAANPGTLLRLEHPVLRYLGRISYGLYLYHMIVIHALAALAARWGLTITHTTLYLTVVPGTLLVAHLSYTYYESIFLRWKHCYAVVPSTA